MEKGHGELELKLRTCIALIGEGVAPCIEDTTFLADQAGILGHPLILWCVTSTNSRCVVSYLRLSSMIVFRRRLSRSCCPLCLGPGLRISLII